LADFHVELANPAKREFKKLPRAVHRQVAKSLTGLATDPRPRGAVILHSYPAFFRIWSGDYRIIYSLQPQIKTAIVVVIRHRKDAYKGLDKLDDKLAAALMKVADTILERSVVEGTA
jgi:mRNA interferase RelE/StbE